MRRALLLSFGLLVASGCVAASDEQQVGEAADAVTEVAPSAVRDQEETGNCWLYATVAWVESLEGGALRSSGAASTAQPIAVAYLDYWDWYLKITTDQIAGKDPKAIGDDLDSGGSWGGAVELIARYGLMRATDFRTDGLKKDANKTNSAKASLSASLATGALRTKPARKKGVLVRKELDHAFGLSAAAAAALTAAFGADGSGSFADGTASASGVVLSPQTLQVLVPRLTGAALVRPLADAIGSRAAPADDPDHRTGAYAWNDVPFAPAGGAIATRAYFKRIQRALHAGVPVPIGWFYADNGEDGTTRKFRTVPATPANDVDSVDHETIIVDYEVDDVPGFGTLAAGSNATPAQQGAALADSAKIAFFRVKDSYGTKLVKNTRATVHDLYVEYLTGKVRVCPAGAKASSARCTDVVPLEDVTLPRGF